MLFQRLLQALALVGLFTTPDCIGQVQIYVWQENQPAAYVFHYRVVNASRDPVVGFTIGNDADIDEYQLQVPPVGRNFAEEPVPGEFGVAVGSAATVPTGWQARMLGSEGSSEVAIFFAASAETPIPALMMMRGFSVAVPTLDPQYRLGKYTVTLSNGARLVGRLQLDDLDAPQPTATVSGGGVICNSSESTTLNVTFTGNGPWPMTWSDGAGGQSSSLNYSRSVSPASNTIYRVTAVSDINRSGTTFGQAVVNVGLPLITAQPAPSNPTIPSNSTVTIRVSVLTPPTPPTFQWYEGEVGSTRKPVGTNSPEFTTPPLRRDTSYWVRVTNRCGARDSAAAVVHVQ